MKPALLIAVMVPLAASPALAAPDQTGPDPENRARRGAEAGMLLPTTLPAKVSAGAGVVTALSGFDGARKTAVMTATADIQMWGPVALRLGASYLPTTAAERNVQPLVGLRVQLLDQERHGLDAGAGLLFRRERYSQDGGEVQLAVMAARRIGRLGLFANAAYGQDPEGDDHDGLLGASALYTAGRHLQLGFDSRLRFDLFSSDGRRQARGEPGFDLTAGPTAAVLLGPLALTAQLGYAAVKVKDVHSGAVALGGVGWAF